MEGGVPPPSPEPLRRLAGAWGRMISPRPCALGAPRSPYLSARTCSSTRQRGRALAPHACPWAAMGST
eukprot:577236-Lingulodinium_polyedra.AAC.1